MTVKLARKMALFQTPMDFHSHPLDITPSTAVFDSTMTSSTSPLMPHQVPPMGLGFPGGAASAPTVSRQMQQMLASQPPFPCSGADIFPAPSCTPSFSTPLTHGAGSSAASTAANPSLFNIGFGAAGDLFRGQPSNLFPTRLSDLAQNTHQMQQFTNMNMFQEAHRNQLLAQQQQHQMQLRQQHQMQQHQMQLQHHHQQQQLQQHVGGVSFHSSDTGSLFHSNHLMGVLDLGNFDQDDFEFLASALSRAATPPPESLAASPDDSPASSPDPSEVSSSHAATNNSVAMFVPTEKRVAPAAARPTSMVLAQTAVALESLAGSRVSEFPPAAVSATTSTTNTITNTTVASAAATATITTTTTTTTFTTSPVPVVIRAKSPPASVPSPSTCSGVTAMDTCTSSESVAPAAPAAEDKVVVTRSSRVVRAPKLDYSPSISAQPAVPRVKKGKVGRPRKHPLPPAKVPVQHRKMAPPPSVSSFSETGSSLEYDSEHVDEVNEASLYSPPQASAAVGRSKATSGKTKGSAAREVARRRETHNVSERHRRGEMKQLLEGLRTIVPSAKDDPKMHTSTILLSAVDYIKELVREESRILKKSAKIRSQNMQLRARLDLPSSSS